MLRVAKGAATGAVIGGVAAAMYRFGSAPLLPPYMTDSTTTAVAAKRREQSAALDQALREAAPAIKAVGQRAEMPCGALDMRCRQDRAAARTEHARLREQLRVKAAAVAYGNATGELCFHSSLLFGLGCC